MIDFNESSNQQEFQKTFFQNMNEQLNANNKLVKNFETGNAAGTRKSRTYDVKVSLDTYEEVP